MNELTQTSAGITTSFSREEFQRHAATRVPGYMLEGLTAYVYDHRPPGHFLMAVLSNDLREACARADEANQRALYDYVYVLFNYAPAMCWGSSKAVAEWLRLGRETREKAHAITHQD